LTYFIFSFHKRYASTSNADTTTFYYHCSQSEIFNSKKSNKSEETEKQRDRKTMTRFKCNGNLNIKIDEALKKVSLEFTHDILHSRPERCGVTDEIKVEIRQQLHLAPKDIFTSLQMSYPDLTQKQVHYWWTQHMQAQYRKDSEQLASTKILLQEAGFNILIHNYDGVKYIGFLTGFFDDMKANTEIICDATCK